MISHVMKKELLEAGRDGRARLLAAIMLLLGLTALLAGWANFSDQQRNALYAQERDQAVFLAQGEKNPHSAAHFGRMAYKPAPPLAAFDPGMMPYMGQVIWLEAHQRNPAMFMPAADAMALSRLGDFSVAGILSVLLPLLIFLMAYSSFAGEQERGTLRQALAAGSGVGTLFTAKFLVIAGVAMALSSIAIALSTVAALLAPTAPPASDTLMRALMMLLTYGLYVCALTALGLLVSSLFRHSKGALLTLLCFWAIAVLVLPRLSANVADSVHPIADGAQVWRELRESVVAQRPAPGSPEYQAAEQFVVSRALGRDVSAEELATLDLNASGLRLEVNEVLDLAALENFYADIYQQYQAQRNTRRWFAAASPTIALLHSSSSLAGTDVSAHQHFADSAERQRKEIVRVMNEDMLLHGAGMSTYLSDAEFWQQVPDFQLEHPPLSLSLRAALADLATLLLWASLASLLAWRVVHLRLAH